MPFDFLSTPPPAREAQPGGGPGGSGGLELPGARLEGDEVLQENGASVRVHRPGGARGPSPSDSPSSLTGMKDLGDLAG